MPTREIDWKTICEEADPEPQPVIEYEFSNRKQFIVSEEEDRGAYTEE